MLRTILRGTSGVALAACTATVVGALLMGAAAGAPVPELPTAEATSTQDNPIDSRLLTSRAETIAVTNLNDSGSGSLRAAIAQVSSGPRDSATTISFSVNGTITLASDLPPISKPVTIDGTSAPTYVVSNAPTPVVEVNGNGHGTFRFVKGSTGSKLLGIAVGNSAGNGVTLGANSITLNNNFIGLNLAGTAAENRGDGVYISPASSRNLIGLNSSGTVGVVSNVISGNRGAGIRMIGSSANTIVANRVGTNAAGTSPIGNGHGGIELTKKSSRNTIGGNVTGVGPLGANNPTGTEQKVTPVFVVPPLGNLISGNARNGVLINGRSGNNILSGNFVGTNWDGTAGIGNSLDGVRITGSHNNVLRGCTVTDNPFVYYNVLSGNGLNGLHVTDSNNTVVQANFFGVGAKNNTIVANAQNGMLFDGHSNNPHVGGVIPLGNVSAGNGANGIEVKDKVRKFLTFNTFGGLYAFLGAAPNGRNGLLITSTGGNSLVRTNVWSGNTGNGIEIGGRARGITVDPNVVGMSTNGSTTLPNGGNGLLITGRAHHNVIGGTNRSVIPQNTFSGNVGYGMVINGGAHHNRVVHSYFGAPIVPWFTPVGIGNRSGGVLVTGKAHDNVIGAANSNPANLISNNIGNGVTLTQGTRRNGLVHDYIGLTRIGTPLPNSGVELVDRGKLNYTRGTSVGELSR